MKKRLLKIITVLCLLCGFFVPVRINASSVSTYAVIEKGVFTTVLKRLSDNKVNKIRVNNYDDIRAVYGISTNNRIHFYFVCIYDSNIGSFSVNAMRTASNGTIWVDSDTNTNYTTPYGGGGNGRIVDGVTYWVYNVELAGAASEYEVVGIPKINTDNYLTAIEYTFGSSAVGPSESPLYGRPANVGYNSRIAGSGVAAANNIDRITWDSEVDSNGTVLPDNARVQVRAIPGQYTGTTKQDLLTKTYTDFVIDNTKAVELVDILASRGVYETKWSEVTSHFNVPFATFNSLIQGNTYWYRNGWIYQIRLQVDDYYSDWSIIYTATGSGVAESETITNSNTLTHELVQQIQIINNLNETTTNWYISETEINMQPYEEPAEGDKPWWAYLLEAIVKAFGDILAFLGNLIGDLMDAITDLFKPAEFTINEYNDFKVEIKENSGLFGQAIDFTNDLKNTFMGVQYQEPILHWQGISFDGIVFLPAADYNLNEYVTMWGLGDFRQIAYICSDGFIFFSLLLLIIRKLNEVLKK